MLGNLEELVEATSLKLKVSQFAVEKDFYVTRAIQAVADLEDEYFELVFQGGTCLAKAHRIIERMSEDCDFRVRAKAAAVCLGKEAKRRALRKFRHKIIESLSNAQFEIDKSNIRVRNEGQFMSIRMRYPAMYPAAPGMKPYLALEYFLGEIKMPVSERPVTTLIQQTLGAVGHINFPIKTVSVIETAAEKWVALTRRVATSKHREHYRDASLVRHLYDLYQIEKNGLFSDKFAKLIARIVRDDQKQYKTHNDDYYHSPIDEIKRALKELQHDQSWPSHWNTFMETMVYGDEKPGYQQVISNLLSKSEIALAEIEPL